MFLNGVGDPIRGQVEGLNQLLVGTGVDELRPAIALERIDGDDPVPSVGLQFAAVAIENLKQVLPNVSIVLFRQN